MRISAIETKYKGYRFRSRLEARWAVFFDFMGFRWEYEKEGYELKESGRYLPDFWLPDFKVFIEVKPDAEPSEAETKMEELVATTKTAGMVVYGVPACKSYRGAITGAYHIDESVDGFFHLDDPEGKRIFRFREFDGYVCALFHYKNEHWEKPDSFSQKYRDAVDAAKSARFEFGEEGLSK